MCMASRTSAMVSLATVRACALPATNTSMPSHGFVSVRRRISPLLVQGLQIREHVPNEYALAIDAADTSGAAALRHLLAFHFGTIDAMEVVHRAHIGIARVSTPLPSRVGHHRL